MRALPALSGRVVIAALPTHQLGKLSLDRSESEQSRRRSRLELHEEIDIAFWPLASDLGPAPHQPIIGQRLGCAFLASADSVEMVEQLARISNLAPSFATSADVAPSPPASSGFSVSRSTGSKRPETFV